MEDSVAHSDSRSLATLLLIRDIQVSTTVVAFHIRDVMYGCSYNAIVTLFCELICNENRLFPLPSFFIFVVKTSTIQGHKVNFFEVIWVLSQLLDP